MSSASAAVALREAYGDRKPPDITRKITACVACRRLKIKCHMNDSKPPCRRCKTRGLSCTVNKSIQMLLENDATWKEAMEQRIAQVENLLTSGAGTGFLPMSTTLDPFSQMSDNAPPNQPLGQSQLSVSYGMTDNSYEISLNFSCGLGAFPATSMTDTKTAPQNQSQNIGMDLISRGRLSSESAQSHFNFFHANLNQYLWQIISDKDDLKSVRSRSPLLTTAICAVAAYCAGSQDYLNALDALKEEVSSKMFAKHNTFDDVRALVIGAFWLDDMSSALSALAVRLAAELNLHRCITKMPFTDPQCYERTRLYFLVYICDHHCSLRYGRPPMTRPLRSLQNPRVLLQCEFSIPADLKLINQMELWMTSSRVLDTFGADVGSSFNEKRSAELGQLGDMYDKWRSEWMQRLMPVGGLDQTSRQVFDLYYSSARLCLFTHVFRGSSKTQTEHAFAKQELAKYAGHAVESALSFIRCLIDGNNALILPSYFSTITAFASVFLLGVCRRGQLSERVKADEVIQELHRLKQYLHSTLTPTHQWHPLVAIAKGLENAIPNGQAANEMQSSAAMQPSFNLNPAMNTFDFGPSPEHNHSWMAFPCNINTDLPGFWDPAIAEPVMDLS